MVITQTFAARWIFPIDTAPMERGAITIADDKIVAIGTGQADVDLGNVAILPGFVNAHTHLDLSGARGLCPPTPDFTQWLRSVIAFRRSRWPNPPWADRDAGFAEALRFGATMVGDINSGQTSLPIPAPPLCRLVGFYELLGLTDERAEQAWHDFQQWRRDVGAHLPDGVRVGLSPHAPYSVGITLFDQIAAQSLPVATHLAETRQELELLHSLDGPFVDFLKEMKVWDPDSLVADPLEILRRFPHGIFIHGNYLDPATPFTPEQTLVVCPRTHAAFGHSHHPFPQMNVRVALGTDSLASNPDLDILAEARCLRRAYPEVAPATILRMLTLNGAEALGFGAVAGSLTPGKSADLVVLPLPDDEPRDPHDLVLDSTLRVRAVMFRGKWTLTNLHSVRA